MTLGILDLTLNRVYRAGEDWKQYTWCQCFAGYILREAGYSNEAIENLSKVYRVTDDTGFEHCSIPIHAQNFANLSDHEAVVLFHGDNTIEMLEWMVSDIKGGDLQDWEFYADKADLYG